MASITSTTLKGIRVFEISGRMDGDAAPDIGRALDAAIDAGHARLVLDLAGVEYMSSPGLREIVRIYKRAQAGGGDLRLSNPSDRVLSVLQLAGLDRAMKIYPTTVEAVASF